MIAKRKELNYSATNFKITTVSDPEQENVSLNSEDAEYCKGGFGYYLNNCNSRISKYSDNTATSKMYISEDKAQILDYILKDG